MKISLDWLKDYVALSVSPEKFAHRLTMSGLEVEKIEAVDGDTLLELEITPNRADCLNMLGIARETAAVFNKRLKYPRRKRLKLPTEKCPVTILDQSGCLRYVGTVITGIKVAPSPEWLQKRLLAIGLRPINNVVDITNFVLLETGQPLHAFDYDKLIDGKIVVRRARKGEQIKTLDAVERTLQDNILVIADAHRPVALAGIIGGEETSVTEQTKNILLESAFFDPILIRRAARALGVSTDSSYRFERNVDLQNVDTHAARAIDLIREYAGGTLEKHTDVFPGKRKIVKKEVSVRVEHINALLGSSFSSAQCKTILKKLEFTVKVKDRKVIQAIPPSFRNDIRRAEDLIEEVARIIGYDNLPESLPRMTISDAIIKDSRYIFRNNLRTKLLAQGLSEAVTYALIPQSSLVKVNLDQVECVRVKNPLTQEQEILRPTLLPNLLSVVRSNLNRGQKEIRLFESGKVYLRDGEQDVLAIIMTGMREYDWRSPQRTGEDFFDIKGVIESLGVSLRFVPSENKIFAAGQCVQIFSSGQKDVIGELGKVKKDILKNWDIKEDHVFFAEIRLNNLEKSQARIYESVSEFPAVTRDVSLAVRQDVSFENIIETARQLGGSLLADIQFLEQYRGEKIPQGQRGLVFSLLYQSRERTLTEEEINSLHQRICQTIVDKFQARMR